MQHPKTLCCFCACKTCKITDNRFFPDNKRKSASSMGIEQRQHISFSIDIPAVRHTAHGEKFDIELQQISLGGCLFNFDENITAGEVFRMLIQLPNGNWLPLSCKAIYEIKDIGIGAKFNDVTRFEQELLSQIISANLKQSGLPLQVDPFIQPPKTRSNNEFQNDFNIKEHSAT